MSDAMWWALALAILQMVLTSFGTVLWQRDKERGSRLEKLEERFQRHAESMPRTYVAREDYIRQMVKIEKKQDQILEGLTALSQSITEHVAKEQP